MFLDHLNDRWQYIQNGIPIFIRRQKHLDVLLRVDGSRNDVAVRLTDTYVIRSAAARVKKKEEEDLQQLCNWSELRGK